MPIFIADTFYPTLAQYGIIGVILFFVFWKRRYKEIYAVRELKFYRVGFLCMAAILLESVADTSYLSGKGMGFIILMATCIREEFHLQQYQKMQSQIESAQQTETENTEDNKEG